MDGINSKMETTEERIRQLKHKTIEITQCKQQREIKCKKEKKRKKRKEGIEQSQSLQTCETITKDLTVMSTESQKERRNKAGPEVPEEVVA